MNHITTTIMAGALALGLSGCDYQRKVEAQLPTLQQENRHRHSIDAVIDSYHCERQQEGRGGLFVSHGTSWETFFVKAQGEDGKEQLQMYRRFNRELSPPPYFKGDKVELTFDGSMLTKVEAKK